MKLAKILFTMGLLSVIGSSFAAQNSDPKVDSALLHLMDVYHVPVVGYAIIDHDQIVAVGTLSSDPRMTVSNDSLFQAASISKSIAAYAALRLVSRGILNLDAPVNDKLASWKIPKNDFQKNHPVTLREILSMTSGLSVGGFAGYEQEKSLPNLLQVLKGKSPANNAPIEVIYQPGSKYFYSGGGFQVLQQAMEDVEKKPFTNSVKELVLDPLGMQNSHYEFPVSEKWRHKIVPAFLSDGTEIKGGWYNYAAPAAAGLWSTPEDLAKFTIDVSHSFVTNRVGLLAKNDAYQMLTRQANSHFGLGVVVDGGGKNLSFRKSGHNTGYYSEVLMFPGAGQGIVIMTDSENGEAIIHTLIPFVAREYNWSTRTPSFDE